MNGFPCKDEAYVTEADFFFSGLANPGVINNLEGSVVTGANVEKIPGLNTLGVSLSRIDYVPGGLNPPHTHPRATEIIFVLDSELAGSQYIAATLFTSTPAVPDNVFDQGLPNWDQGSQQN